MNNSYLINCDMGESYGQYQIGNDEALMPFIDAANIACGMHAGDPVQMDHTIDLALAHQVQIGAHPGYPDRQGFGRRNMEMSTEELSSYIKYQVAALDGMTQSKGARISYVKPHGAMYNHMVADVQFAETVVEAIRSYNSSLKIMGLAGSHVKSIVENNGGEFIAEAFADRIYEENGQLRSRQLDDAVIHDAQMALEQVQSILQKHELRTYNGQFLSLKADSFCIHGDNPAALTIAKTLHTQLKQRL